MYHLRIVDDLKKEVPWSKSWAMGFFSLWTSQEVDVPRPSGSLPQILRCIHPGAGWLLEKPPAQPDEDAGSNNRDDEVCKPAKSIEAQNTSQKTADKGTDDANDDIAEQAAIGIHDFAGNPADDGSGDE